jgi:hypothetical protein
MISNFGISILELSELIPVAIGIIELKNLQNTRV